MNLTNGRKALCTIATAATLGFALFGNAYAVGEVDYPDRVEVVREMTRMRDTQIKKDGSITREQFLQMQGKLFDMAAKNGKMTAPQFKAFIEDFKVFGQ